MTKEKFERVKAYYAGMKRGGITLAADDVAELAEALEQAQQERDNWENDARERQRNTEYYQSLLDEIGGHFGEAAFMRDDGAKSDSIVRAKVPELVERLQIRYGVACEQRDAAVAELERMKARPCEG